MLTFASGDAIDAVLGSPTVPAVRGELPNFTDIGPVISRAVAL
ncbi:hypothetical protein [Sphingomonas sp. AP4-R1]|nr:hypothetical protein [Sphingomonas sp. AP4-R1]